MLFPTIEFAIFFPIVLALSWWLMPRFATWKLFIIAVSYVFINLLTEPDDLVLDPFAGSNTTGAVAERLERRWVAVEIDETYLRASKFRFE